jgi:hypothetical protein
MDDRARLTYLTRHYYELQGIRIAPMWLCLLAMQMDNIAGYASSARNDVFAIIAMFAMVFFMWLAGRYYRSRFGRLDPQWISLPTNLFYWCIVFCFFVWSIYSLVFLQFFGNLPYWFTIIWISPLFNAENPPLRRIYFAIAGAVVIFSALFLQLTHRDGSIIIVIQCLVLIALGIADHLLLMSLLPRTREPARVS